MTADTRLDPVPATDWVTILGSTGSVGEQTLDVIDRHPHLQVFALTAHRNVDKLEAQCLHFRPRYAVMVDAAAAAQLAQRLAGSDTEILSGPEGLVEVVVATEVTSVMAAIVGAAGLAVTLAAVEAGKRVLLANKEALVMAGELFMAAVARHGATLLPIDSEHNAIFQCLPAAPGVGGRVAVDVSAVRRVLLTASGGPFLDLPAEALAGVTPAEACRHPRWRMGPKISVDSATLMNKGLEFIEACFLFGLPPAQVDVVIHPQSIVHSLVEYVDGSMVAQMATADMRIPIAYGLSWPRRMASGAAFLDLAQVATLEFRRPDLQRFPCLQLGMEAARAGGTTPAILNAANEVAVQAFLDGRLSFARIPVIIAAVLDKMPCEQASTLAIIRAADAAARNLSNTLIKKEI